MEEDDPDWIRAILFYQRWLMLNFLGTLALFPVALCAILTKTPVAAHLQKTLFLHSACASLLMSLLFVSNVANVSYFLSLEESIAHVDFASYSF